MHMYDDGLQPYQDGRNGHIIFLPIVCSTFVSVLLFCPAEPMYKCYCCCRAVFLMPTLNNHHRDYGTHRQLLPSCVRLLAFYRRFSLASRIVQLLAMLALTLSLALGPLLFFGSALIVASAGYVVYQCFFSPIAAFPGPFAAKFTKIWRAYATYRGQWHREIIELHRRYGNVVRIGPNEL